MRISGLLLVLMFTCLVAPVARAEVVSVSASGFVSQHELVLAASPEKAYTALVDDVALWWDAAHSFGGDAGAFSLEDRAGGCFCEQSEGIAVEHMRVVNAQNGRSLTMRGGLGPLQGMAVTGAMLFRFEAHPEGSLLKYRYTVGGYAPGGLESLAEPVDRVQLGQLQRLARYLQTNQALNTQ